MSSRAADERLILGAERANPVYREVAVVFARVRPPRFWFAVPFGKIKRPEITS
jgi:hypothetical protein